MTLRKYLICKIQAIEILARRIFHYTFFKSKDIILLSHVVCRFKPATIKIGKRFTVLNGAIFEFNNSAHIEIGNHCTISYGALMAIKGKFKMGDFVMIGEYTSIRDYTHNYAVDDIPMAASADIVADITIGNNIWIGRGCIVMPGTIIDDGVVVGANSVVKGHLKKNGIYAGSPVKLIKYRL